jgi:ribonuclease/clavin/mitogillin
MHDWFAFKDVEPRPAAAAIILSEGADGQQEVLLARRNKALAFMGGHHVFPGGRLDREDTPSVAGAQDAAIARAIFTAAREVFEESGLFIARHQSAHHVLEQERDRLLRRETSFAAILERLGAELHAEDFIPAGQWITPPFSPIRFHTQYFIYHHRGARYESIETHEGEIVGLDWWTPHDARRRWHRGEIRLSTPVAFVLQHLARMPLDTALPWLHRTPGMDLAAPNRFELRRGIFLIPVRSATLPPATHTNCVIIGEERIVVVDPGAHDPVEQEHLIQHVEHLLALGAALEAVVLSHSHPDHTGAAGLLAERYGAPLWAHPETARQTGLPIQRELHEGDVLRLPGDPDWEVHCLHTPGHDPGHLALLERSTGTLLAGDLIANPGTILISPDYGGDMTHYLESLQRAAEETYNFLIPGHGMPFWNQDPKQALKDLAAHRLKREQKILDAISNGAMTEDDLLAEAYADTPMTSWPLARHQLRAHLQRLGIHLER